jgi:hypothetical protein
MLRATGQRSADPFVLEVLFAPAEPAVMTPHGIEVRPELSVEEVFCNLIPNAIFQNLKKQFKRKSFRVGGRGAFRCSIGR